MKLAELDDCPMCLSAGSVRDDRCQVCDARLAAPAPGSGTPNGVVDLPPAAPSGPARPSDLLEELEAIAKMVSFPQTEMSLANACLRAATTMMMLRAQLLQDISDTA